MKFNGPDRPTFMSSQNNIIILFNEPDQIYPHFKIIIICLLKNKLRISYHCFFCAPKTVRWEKCWNPGGYHLHAYFLWKFLNAPIKWPGQLQPWENLRWQGISLAGILVFWDIPGHLNYPKSFFSYQIQPGHLARLNKTRWSLLCLSIWKDALLSFKIGWHSNSVMYSAFCLE